uniref:Glycolipid transfer protein-like n=1 Tax=Gadus morhua TaxID=8049 RepID=A0A8C5CXI5_GADMO
MALLMDHQFRLLPADKQVETRPFLEACSYLPFFIGKSCSLNIIAVYESNPGKYKTLQQILEAEKEQHGSQWPRVGATLALMWLKRGLRFIQVFLQSVADGERDEANPNLLRVNFSKAYDASLRKYHGWLMQNLHKAIMYAAPYKTDFLKSLSKGREVKDEECLEKIRKFLNNFSATVDTIYEVFSKMNADLEYKV